jgi:hypothetical protein
MSVILSSTIGESVMGSVRENATPLLTAAIVKNGIITAIAEFIYATSIRRALRAIARFG